jgi:glycosyltransferase involved in cell wall biosynthesis
MRILHLVNNSGRNGGVGAYVHDLLPELASHSHDNIFMYRWKDSDPPTSGVHASFHLPVRSSTHDQQIANRYVKEEQPQVVYKLASRIIQEERPQVVYMHDVYNPELILEISRIVPTVGYVHIFYPVCPGLGKLFHRGEGICDRPYGLGCIPTIYLRRCSSARNPVSVYQIMRITREYLNAYKRLPRVIVGSRYMKHLMIQNGIHEENIDCLPPHFVRKRNGSEDLHDIGKEILFVGRLEYEKGVPYLLKAMRSIPAPYRLIIAGDGSLKDTYVKLTEQMGLFERVKFVGWLSGEQLEKAYQQCSLVVVPSIMAEPFGKVGIEAMNYGKPVVAFDVGGISDWLIDSKNGYLVPVKDIEQLGGRICLLLQDKGLRTTMGKRGRQFVEENFQSKDHVERLTTIFQKAVQSWSPG